MHITFRIHQDWDGLDPKTRLLTEYHFYISDDKAHNNQFVQYYFSLHQAFLMQQGYPLPVEHIVFSDGCSAQFKCAKNLYFVARYSSLTCTNDCLLAAQYSGIGLVQVTAKEGGMEPVHMSSKLYEPNKLSRSLPDYTVPAMWCNFCALT